MSAYCPKCGKKFEETKPNWRYCNECGNLIVKNVIFFLGLVIILPKGRQRHRYRAFYDFLEKVSYKPKHARTLIDVLAKPVDIIDDWVETFYNWMDKFLTKTADWFDNMPDRAHAYCCDLLIHVSQFIEDMFLDFLVWVQIK